MKIGIIYCAYNCFSFASESIKPFIQAKKDNLISKISCVSVPFAEYFNIKHENDQTTEFLFNLEKQNLIDKVFDEPKYILEHEARDFCLQYLRSNDCDLIWLVDGDEFYSKDNISKIITVLILKIIFLMANNGLMDFVLQEFSEINLKLII